MGDLKKGISFEEALADMPPEWIRDMRVDFAGARNDELRAALVLMVFSGKHFKLHDKDGRQGAVDFVAKVANERVDFAEVTSTRQNVVVKQLEFFEELPKRIMTLYKGRVGWDLNFKDGWAERLDRKAWRALPKMIASELEKLSDGGSRGAYLESVPWILAVKTHDPDESISVSGLSYVTSDLRGTYVERLGQFLCASQLIKRKTMKLERASNEQRDLQTFCEVRNHLYLHAPYVGGFDDLSPYPFDVPGRFHGTFVLPPSLNEIWLDSWSGYLYHWSRESGWTEHSLRSFHSFYQGRDIFDQIEDYLA